MTRVYLPGSLASALAPHTDIISNHSGNFLPPSAINSSMRVELGPGDRLAIPPYWSHHVCTALEPAMSVSLFAESDQARQVGSTPGYAWSMLAVILDTIVGVVFV